MKNQLLVLFPIKCSIKRDSLYTASLYLKAEVSKVVFSIESCKFQRPRGLYFFLTPVQI
jgi:hypothetical protein